jgi:hypothetical protein
VNDLAPEVVAAVRMQTRQSRMVAEAILNRSAGHKIYLAGYL